MRLSSFFDFRSRGGNPPSPLLSVLADDLSSSHRAIYKENASSSRGLWGRLAGALGAGRRYFSRLRCDHPWAFPLLSGVLVLQVIGTTWYFWNRRTDFLHSAFAARLSLIAGYGINDRIPFGKATPLSVAIFQDNFGIVKHAFKEIRAFDFCQTIHDWSDVLFPPYRDSLPPDWESETDPIPDLTSDLKNEERFQTALQIRSPSKEEIAHRLFPEERSGAEELRLVLKELASEDQNADSLSSLLKTNAAIRKASVSIPLTKIFQTLVQMNPLYAKAWDLSGQPGLLLSGEIVGGRVHPKGFGSAYHQRQQAIEIDQEALMSDKLELLVFETLNAVQRDALAFTESLDRESFALGKEWIEKKTVEWTARILYEKFQPVKFSKYWKITNQPSAEGLDSHTDYYRKQWDRHFLADWIENHPDRFQKRLNELSQQTLRE